MSMVGLPALLLSKAISITQTYDPLGLGAQLQIMTPRLPFITVYVKINKGKAIELVIHVSKIDKVLRGRYSCLC